MTKPISLIFIACLPIIACAEEEASMVFKVVDDSFVMEGVIDSDIMDTFHQIQDAHPNIRNLVLQNIGGSIDDAANLEFSRYIHEQGFSTRVPSDGMIASGGTDLFLAGTTRTLDPGACIGVHSWAAEDYTALDLPRSDPEHTDYLNFYEDIDINPDFYWFTVDAAPAEDMHWMTATEVAQFQATSSPTAKTGAKASCDQR